MRLGLILDQIVFEHQHRHSTDEAFIRFVEAVAAPHFETIDFCTRVLDAEADGPYVLDPARVTVRRLPWYSNIGSLCLHAPALLPRTARLLDEWMSQWDMIMACGVHPITTLALRIARRRRVPAQLWVRGNITADIRLKYHGVQRLAGLAVARIATAGLPHGTPVVSIGRDDYPFLARMGRVHVAFDSKFGDEDLAAHGRQPDTAGRPARLLYAGRISAEKGLDVLMTALEHTVGAAGQDARLTLVGADFVGSTYGDAFRARVRQSPIADRITLAGYVPYGPTLFALYDSHDVLVLPSFTEGFPQVLLEAMARGLPIVATAVGGVPHLVRDGENGLLVPPGDARALGAAIERLLVDAPLWTRLSREGLACASRYTRQAQVASITAFTAECVAEARSHVGSRHSGGEVHATR